MGRNLNTELNGIAPSLHTPFNLDKSIDFESLKKLLDHTINSKCSGMLLGAVAGETQNLEFEEKIELMDFALKYVNDRIPVIVGCSSSNQNERIKLSEIAKSKGARWFLVQAPTECTREELLKCFEEISLVGPKNLMIQDLSWNDYGLSDEDILNLFNKIESFKALKIEVINSGPKYSRILEKTNNTLHLSGGWAISGLIEAIRRGVHSFIPSTMEVIYNNIYKLAKEGKVKEAREIFNLILPIISFTHQHISVSIMFSKLLRVKEGIFQTSICRGDIAKLDKFQIEEAMLNINKIISIQNSYKKIN